MLSSTHAPRIITIDVVRGVAVLGILLLNIVSFAMPSYAYLDPTFYGGAAGANWWVWATTFVLADSKMRALFTMLFGASMVLIAERAAKSGCDPLHVHLARMATLLIIGLGHAYLIWSGDILTLYALCGTIAFAVCRWRTAALLATATLLMGAHLIMGAAEYAAARHFEARATAPGSSSDLRAAWRRYRAAAEATKTTIPAELSAFRGGWNDVAPMRASLAARAQQDMLDRSLAETLAFMLLGMALFRTGFFSGSWSKRAYGHTMVVGYGLCLPAYLPLVAWIDAGRFDPLTMLLTQPLHVALLCPPMAMAHAAATIRIVQRDNIPLLVGRLASVGRMALSNYLLTSVLCTVIFYGYGVGWFGRLERWQLYPVVAGVWLIILLWSPAWIRRFDHGPAEQLWRSAVNGLVRLSSRKSV